MFRTNFTAFLAALSLSFPTPAVPQSAVINWIGDELASPAVVLPAPEIHERDLPPAVSGETLYRAVREVVISPPPDHDTLFFWRGDKSKFKEIEISFLFSTSSEEEGALESYQRKSGLTPPDDLRSFTVPALMLYPEDDLVHGGILMTFLVDRLFPNEAPWITVATAVAGEVYGPVQAFLEAVAAGEDPNRVMGWSGRSRRAGIDFLLRLWSRFPEGTPEHRQLERELSRLTNPPQNGE